MYQILIQEFAGQECRVVRHPQSTGRPKKDSGHSPDICTQQGTGQSSSTAPQSTGGGGGLSSSGPDGSVLDHTFEFAHQSKPALNPTTFHRAAREKVRRAAIAAELRLEKINHMVFLTGTFPFNNLRSASVIGENSGWIIKSLKNWFRQFELPDRDIYVWERHKNGSLHLHYCCCCPSDVQRVKLIKTFHQFWTGMIEKLSQKTGVNLWLGKGNRDWSVQKNAIQTRALEVEKSVARYISKYISKKAGKQSELFSQKAVSPRRWWGCSQSLKEDVIKLTIENRIKNLSWLQSRNKYERIKLELEVVIQNGNYYESKSELADVDSFTIYYPPGWTLPSEMISQFQTRKYNQLKMKSKYEIERDKWRAENSLPSLQLLKGLREGGGSGAVKKIAIAIATDLNELILDPPLDHIDFMKRLTNIYDESINRLEKARLCTPYLHKLDGDRLAMATQKVVFEAWNSTNVLIREYKVSKMTS